MTTLYAPVLNNSFACAKALFKYPQPFDAYPTLATLGRLGVLTAKNGTSFGSWTDSKGEGRVLDGAD